MSAMSALLSDPTRILNIVVLLLPAYFANGIPVLSAKLFKKRHPIDCYKRFIDGKRILGDGKTIEGFFLGLFSGCLVGFLLEAANLHSFFGGFVMSFGALLGDIIGSFVKRRLGLRRGAPFPVVDQSLFVLTALFLYSMLVTRLDINVFIIAVLITIPIHLLTNVFAYLLGLKKEPW